MKKLFVSLPMRGLNEREIRQRMRYLKALVENELKEEIILMIFNSIKIIKMVLN